MIKQNAQKDIASNKKGAAAAAAQDDEDEDDDEVISKPWPVYRRCWSIDVKWLHWWQNMRSFISTML